MAVEKTRQSQTELKTPRDVNICEDFLRASRYVTSQQAIDVAYNYNNCRKLVGGESA